MPRYYFHLHNDVSTRDEEGTELPDAGAARDRACREIIQLAADSVKSHRHLVLHHHIEITDEAGEAVDSVTFGDVVDVRE